MLTEEEIFTRAAEAALKRDDIGLITATADLVRLRGLTLEPGNTSLDINDPWVIGYSPTRNLVVVTGNKIPISLTHARILTLALNQPNHLLSYEQATKELSRNNITTSATNFRVQVKRFRKLIQDDSDNPHIKTHPGVGYQFSGFMMIDSPIHSHTTAEVKLP